MYIHGKQIAKDRKVTWLFDGPVIESNEGDSEVWRERVKVCFWHSPSTKKYYADVRSCCFTTRNGYSMERTHIGGDPYTIFLAEEAPRFNVRQFNAFCAKAEQFSQELLTATPLEEVHLPVAVDLLRTAANFYSKASA